MNPGELVRCNTPVRLWSTLSVCIDDSWNPNIDRVWAILRKNELAVIVSRQDVKVHGSTAQALMLLTNEGSLGWSLSHYFTSMYDER